VFLDAFYLGMVPFFVLRGRRIRDFERDGDQTRIHLEGNVVIESNLTQKSLRVSINGDEILRDDAVFCPLADASNRAGEPPSKIACYSLTPRRVNVSLPKNWIASSVTAVALFADRRERLPIDVKDGKIALSLEERRPVILYRDAAISCVG
jgi:hypothetical protein